MSPVVGLDIGTSAVRAAQLDLGPRVPALSAFSQVGLLPGTVVDGEVQDAHALTGALRRLWQNGRFGSNAVVVGVAGLRVITRELDIPWVSDAEVDSAVRFQSEEVIPFSPEKTLLSTQVLGDNTGPDGARTRRVLVAAAHKDVVDGIVGAVEGAGLEVTGVDLVSSALVRALVDPADMSERPEAIVSVGAGLTVMVVHQAGRPLFIRTVATGGNAATEAIASSLDLPMADAENLKRTLDGSTPQLKSAQRATVPVVEELVGEIRNSLHYFSSMPGREPLHRVLVTGGGSLLTGFLEELQGQVRLPVMAVSPLDRMDTSGIVQDPGQVMALAPVFATAVGLVLPEPNAAVSKFNLVPPEILRRAFERKVTRYSSRAAAVVAVALVGFGGWKLWSVHSAENTVANLNSSVAALNAEIPTYNKVVETVNELHASQAQVSHLTSVSVDWAAVVNELDTVAPGGLLVNAFQGTGGPGSPAAGASTSTTPGATTTGGIGTLTVTVGGSFPNTAHFSPVAQWIDAISGSPMFAPPSVSAVANAANGGSTDVTFQSVVSILSNASLAKKGSY